MKPPALVTMFVALLGACATQHADGPVPPRNEIVMVPHSQLTATTSVGIISIKAGKGLNRCYTWDGDTRCVQMWPRTSRWHGSMGLYFPGPGEHWPDHDGITRGVVEEGQQHFATTDEAMAWLDSVQKYLPIVYRTDGLVVGWKKVPDRNQLNVDVWQIFVAGVKATDLPGGDDTAIVVAGR
jgi:hypothetical protein